ncbi:DUF397 domain-containing protein [Nocardiopsis sp. CNT312]|uniref:DUF397 domain-containing protein n=1 Tax=Nocardiopsis sp. CNT312 TaxID=1137268 RepID=UPI0004BA3007|nr:DUF397 domain-containing protein [Nocardiopsis sp. CNT312]
MSDWRKSSYSTSGGNCVEVREHGNGADVRDTQNRDQGTVSVSAGEWVSLLSLVTR